MVKVPRPSVLAGKVASFLPWSGILRVMSLRPRLFLMTLSLSITAASSAHAYCRTHTGDRGQSTCPPVCANKGTPLAWHKSELSYGFNVRGFPGLSDTALRRIFAASTAPWENVQCNGQSIGLDFTQLPGTTTLEQGPAEGEDHEPNENVITHYDPAGWDELGYSSRAFAITAVWFSKSGQISGADMGFNGGMDLYGDCAVASCASGSSLHTDLQNVATHEFGHFLGLSHSDDPAATMSCEAQASDTDKRTLEADDIAGICATYPPGSAFIARPEQEGGCSLSPGSRRATHGLAFVLGTCLLVVLRRLPSRFSRRRRRAALRSLS
jgi:hypothetical protein